MGVASAALLYDAYSWPHPIMQRDTPTMDYGIERGTFDGMAGFSWHVKLGDWGVSGWCRTAKKAQENVDHAKGLVATTTPKSRGMWATQKDRRGRTCPMLIA